METLVSTDLTQAEALLSAGDVVAIPTETVYGLAASAFDVEAIKKVYALKQRPLSDPLILHVSGLEAVTPLVTEVPLWAEKLMTLFWPGPLTVLLPKSARIPELVTAGLPRVALRAPNHPLTLKLLERLPFPLAAPSANPFGRISPTTPQHVLEYFQGKIPFVLDGGPCTGGVESTIIGEENGRLVIYRPGLISKKTIEDALEMKVGYRLHTKDKPQAPGQLPRHYAPSKPLLASWENPPLEKEASIIFFAPPDLLPKHPHVHILSESGDPAQAAQRLYEVLHACEQEPTAYILAQTVPQEGMGLAVHDRLRRASTPSVFTIGHSNHPWETFLELLHFYEVGAILDIRKKPSSTIAPQYNQGRLQHALVKEGILYDWQPVPNRILLSIERLRNQVPRVALMCAEADPTRCHRYRQADELAQKGYAVFHIYPNYTLRLHQPVLSLPFGE